MFNPADKPGSNARTDEDLEFSAANKQYDAAQIIYGLEIRGVRAKSVFTPGEKSGTYQILLISPTPIQLKIAQESIEPIWNAILEEYPRATNESGCCYFCDYDVSSLPKPTICPECGVNVDTIESRRAMRDRRKL
ncbi:MAG: hypothetical protein P1U42_05745 [Phycisphaerales bacterium]|nr:hypothetical protein [Phycisphaerales bacterium]